MALAESDGVSAPVEPGGLLVACDCAGTGAGCAGTADADARGGCVGALWQPASSAIAPRLTN
jgi:hypothetical protein